MARQRRGTTGGPGIRWQAGKRAEGSSSDRRTPPSSSSIPNAIPASEQELLREFVQALTDEIETIKRGGGGSIVTVFDGRFVRKDGPLFIYVFSTESALVLMDEAPAEVEVGGRRFNGQIVSVQGTEVAVGIEHDFGPLIEEAQLITNLWYLLQALRNRFEEVLSGQRTIDTRLPQKLFGTTAGIIGAIQAPLDLPAADYEPNEDQKEAVRKALGSDVSFIWGPPGTGKTDTIGFIAAALLSRGLRILVVSHTNIATDNAMESVAKLLEDSPLYERGKLIRFGTIAKDDLPKSFPMVTLEKAVETLGRDLKARLDELKSQLLRLHSALAPLQEAASLLYQAEHSRRQLEATQAEMAKAKQELSSARGRQAQTAAQVRECQERLARAQSSGALKRLLLGLDTARILAELGRLQSQLVIVENTLRAAKERYSEVSSALERLTNTASRLLQEAAAGLAALGLTAEQLNAKIRSLSNEADQTIVEIRTVEEELGGLEAKILREARLIATTLTKATISKDLEGQPFDALIVDEASMAPMPGLYYAAAHISQKVVIVGDFRQLPPISVAASDGKQKLGRECPMAERWLARDIFNQAGVEGAVNRGQQEPHLTLLRFQYRMHPDISAIPNHLIYGGKLVDKANPVPRLPHDKLGAKPLVLYDISSAAPWSSRLEKGSRYNLYSAVVTATLAERAIRSGSAGVGVITPYSAQARLLKLIAEDRGLGHLKISTVHRFQGLEQDIVIFDIAEGPMPRYGPPPFLTGVELTSNAAKLINVAITRPRAQLVIIAYCDYLKLKLAPNAILSEVLGQVERCGEVRDSQDVVDSYFCEDFERWSRLLDPHNDKLDPDDSTLYTEQNFFSAFFADLRRAQKEIIIVSPFLASNRAEHFLNLFRAKFAERTPIRVFTRTRREQRGDMFRQAEMVFDALKAVGIELVERRGLHQKLAILDRMVAWEGSLNILSHSEGRTTENMRRIGSWEKPALKTCAELVKIHSLGSDSETPPGERQPIRTDRICSACGSVMVLVPGKFGVFVGCTDYPRCKEHFSIRRDERILTDAICLGSEGKPCGQPMMVRLGRRGAFLSCSTYPACRGRRNIS